MFYYIPPSWKWKGETQECAIRYKTAVFYVWSSVAALTGIINVGDCWNNLNSDGFLKPYSGVSQFDSCKESKTYKVSQLFTSLNHNLNNGLPAMFDRGYKRIRCKFNLYGIFIINY